MDSRIVALGLVAVAVFSVLRIISQWRTVSRKRRSIDWDEHFIQQLRKAGVNTFEEHLVDFFFTLPDRGASERLAATLRADGYLIDIRQAPDSGSFSVDAQRSTRLIVPEMQVISARFTELAEQHGGKYDNWAVAMKRD
jgi:hypothetical protein